MELPPSLQVQLGREKLHEFAKKIINKVGDRRGSDLTDADVDILCKEILDTPKCRLKLVYRHACRYLGCREKGCLLCQTNPCKVCLQDFDDRYYVNDEINISKCNAPVYIDIVNALTGEINPDPIPGLTIRICILDGRGYTQATNQHRILLNENDELLDTITITYNKKGGALLKMSEMNGECSPSVTIPCSNSQSIKVPRLVCTQSSESMLRGKNPPFILYAYAMADTWMENFDILPAVSSPFVVASRRLKNKCKVDLPLDSDDITALKHIGRETVRKLRHLDSTLQGSDVLEKLPTSLHSIQTVGQFRTLTHRTRHDERLQAVLKRRLKFRDDVWRETVEHAGRCISVDNRVRVWCPFSLGTFSNTVGYVFGCRMGQPNLKSPIGVVKYFPGDSEDVACKIEHVPECYKMLLQSVQSKWYKTWNMHGHPGWAIENLDTVDFISSNAPYFFFTSAIVSESVPPRHALDPLVPRSAFAQESIGHGAHSIGDQVSELVQTFPPEFNESLRLLSGEFDISIARQMSLDHLLKHRTT